MTREEFRQIPVEKAADILWQISDRNGNLLEIIDIARGKRGGARYEQVCLELERTSGSRTILQRFYTLDGYDAGAIVREIVALHPKADEIVAEFDRRRDEKTIEVIEAIMADLDKLSSEPAPTADTEDHPADLVEDDDTFDDSGLMTVIPPPRRRWFIGRRAGYRS